MSGTDEIIAWIYDAVFEPAGWDRVAKAFADTVRGSSCFILDSAADGSAVAVLSGRGLEAAGVPEYQEHFHRLDIWKERLLADRGDSTIPFHALVPQPRFQNSEIFNDWVKPALAYEVYWGLGRRIGLAGDRIGLVGVHRPRRKGEMGVAEVRAIERYIPHLRRALRLRQLLGAAQGRSDALGQVCDMAPGATMLVDGRGRLDYANRAASELLQARDGLSLDMDGALKAIDRVENDALHRRIAAACGVQPEAPGDDQALRINRKEAGPLLVTVAAAPADRFALQRRLAILGIDDPWVQGCLDPNKIVLALGVTPAEARLIATLAQGEGLRKAASRLGITYNTARTQLRSVLEKSGMHSQGELMFRVGRLR
jgi:DNA-binding CsgD family transcriptional regulator